MIKLGSDNIGKIYLGDSKIGKAYLGSDLVYQSSGTPEIPDGPVDWISTDGLAYINSGITGEYPKSFSMKALFPPAETAIAGSRGSSGENRFLPAAGYGTNESYSLGMGYDYYWSVGDITSAVANKIPMLIHTAFTPGSNGGQLVFYRSEADNKFTLYSHGSTAGINTGYPMCILGYNSGGNKFASAKGTRLYYFRIYSDWGLSTIQFDGVPYKYNGQFGLWDNVTNTFFGNANSSGHFKGGLDSHTFTPVEYIETDGTACIDTGILAGGDASAEIKYLAKSGSGATQMVMGTSAMREDSNLRGLALSFADKAEIAYKYFYASNGLDISSSLTNNTPFIARFSYPYNTFKYVYVKEIGDSDFRGYSANVSGVNVNAPMYLFAGYNPETGLQVGNCIAGSRIYYCKIYADANYTKLVFDGVPCVYKGEYGLWDNISNSFFGNAASSGAFTGPSINS